VTPLARVEAAILRLETLKTESTPGPWYEWTDDLTNEVDVWHDQEARCHVANFGVAGERGVLADAELVSALHSTIDAQLAILRDAAARMRVEQNQDGIPLHYRHQLALADAILKAVNS